MLGELKQVLGPAQHGRLYRYLGWLCAWSVLEALTLVLLVPVLAALLHGDFTQACRWLLAMTGMMMMTCFARYIQSMTGFMLALVILETVHTRLGDHVARLPLGWFSSEKVGRLSRTATSGTMMVTNLFAHLLAPVVSGILVPAIIALAMLWLDWRLGVTALLCSPLIYIAHHWAADAIGRNDDIVDSAAAVASNRVVEFARNQHTLRAFGRTENGFAPLEAAIKAQRDAGGSMLAQTFPRILAGGLSVQLTFAILVAVGLWLVLHGSVDPIQLVALLALAARFVGPLAEAAARSGLVRIAKNDLRRLAEILATPQLPEPETPRQATAPGLVEFDSVSFAYRDGKRVINDVNLRFAPRSMTAIVGASGSGKSTLLKLIMRFFDVTAGQVRVGGVDVRAQDGATLMAQIAPVLQDVYLFDDTLEANIRIGRPDAEAAEWRDAARLAGVEEIAHRLPNGWATRVGEGGNALSGGERQRVSLARALLKNAPIVLLDEATAALDAENERFVQEAILQVRCNATLIVVAHQLPTVMAADRIVVLDDGRVIESGTHDELMALGQRYAAFWHERHRAKGWRLNARSVS